MLGRFSRTELLLGHAAMEKLAQTTVAIFGIGGVGSYVAEGLVRSGIGHLSSSIMTGLSDQYQPADSCDIEDGGQKEDRNDEAADSGYQSPGCCRYDRRIFYA